MRTCANCGQPTHRNPWAVFCRPCLAERERVSAKSGSTKYNASAKGKLVKQRYELRHREAILARKRDRFRRTYVSPVGQIRRCATVLCPGTFVYGRWSGHRKFCDDCRVAFGTSPAYGRRGAA